MAKRQTIAPSVDWLIFLWNTFVAVGSLSFVIGYKINKEEYFPSWSSFFKFQNIRLFLEDQWGPVILSTILFALYFIISIEAKSLRRVGDKLFSHDNKPKDWRYVKNRKLFTLMVVLMIITFLGLAWFVDNVAVFCGLFAAILLLAALKVIKLREAIKYYFNGYPPVTNDRYKPFILERRRVMEHYFERPQVRAFLLEAVALFSISIVALLPHLNIPIFRGVPYLMIVGIVATHEYFVWKWRFVRNRKLKEIDQREDEVDLKNEEEQTASLKNSS